MGWSPKLLPGSLAEPLITYWSLLIDPKSGAVVRLVALMSGKLGATIRCIGEMQFQERPGAAAEPQDIEIPELHTLTVGCLAPMPPCALGEAACELPRRPTAEEMGDLGHGFLLRRGQGVQEGVAEQYYVHVNW